MNKTDRLIRLAKQHKLPHIDKWPEGRLEEWLNWMDASGCVFTCYPDQQSHDNPMGFAVVRPIRELAKKHQHYRIDDNGQTLYVDMAVAQTMDVLRALGFAILGRFGQRQWLASEKNGKLKIHNLASVRRCLLRKH